ncbi:hypothetical protein BSZ39_02270 [Bowdeniella nasicola]|uniref:Major facilitator superfamily (MFS) profile domain-containing protein n=1 Tax=Bowdeniella nasicola TaxID=208480 RepID=A0A1Q5Q4W3_9ACTO|nr:MFS transporter [Bowdeniella nasicola]OKL54823.1 hypothetical protein BSZ39_02270 [Bowdeniella nasicola]
MDATLADDRPLVSKGWIGSYGVMYLGINIAWSAPSQLLIANQILAWHPEDKEARFAFIMSLGGLLGLVVSPLVGILSDKTRTRFGRRAPWIVIGAVCAAASLVALAFSPNYVLLVIGWAAFQIFIAAAVNASQAIPPDRVSRQQYGVVSGVMGIGWTMALVVGTLLGESLPLVAAYLASAALLLALCVPYLIWHNKASVLPTQDDQVAESSALTAASRGAVMDAELVGGFTHRTETAARSLADYRDFMWVFISRLAATLGNTVALFYLLYYLRDHIKLADPDQGVLILTVIYAVVVIGASILSGRASDAAGVRKPFVFFSCLGLAGACLVMAFAHSFTAVIIAAVVLGASWGTFTAIDQALINQVLPYANTRGRDIGFMSMAVALPNLASPVLAAFALLVLGGYPGLYLISGLLAVIGAISVLAVRGSR